jgi:serine/threonine-protein kinase
MTVKCPKCETDNTGTAKFCSECASPLQISKDIPVTKTIQTSVERLSKGSSIADRYNIIEELGQGGMGIVYKAEDIKLKRTVALKFLAPELIRDPEAKERFIHEAQAASALDHPNICTVYEIDESDGQMFIAMAYVEGQSLRKKVSQGPLKLDETLDIAIQVAEGLQEAHGKGIVHRDIKSANIMVTSKGQAKIMDFGVAKLAGRTKFTQTGTTMGTVAYMSPEQSRGERVDFKTDIWSLGVVIYELIVGSLPFKGDHEQAVMYSILNEEPEPMTGLRTGVPMELERIVSKMLAKNKAARYQHVDEIPVDLRGIKERPDSISMTATQKTSARSIKPRSRFLRLLPWSLTCLMALVLAVAHWSPWRAGPSEDLPSIRLTVPTQPLAQPSAVTETRGNTIVISPDGTKVVYAIESEKTAQLYLREIDQFDSTPISGTENAYSPFFSPDGQWVGFFSEGKLKKVLLSGGQPVVLCSTPATIGGTWGPDDKIVFGVAGEGLKQVSASGGVPEAITKVDFENGEWSHCVSEILPGGKKILYTIYDGSAFALHIVMLDLETKEKQILIEGAAHAYYAPTGHLIYSQEGTLMAAPFDVARLRLTGPSISVLDGIMVRIFRGTLSSFSQNGTLIYIRGSEQTEENMLVWVDRQGKSQPVTESQRLYLGPRISPDGKKLAMWIRDEKGGQVWIYDISRGTLSRLTSEGQNFWPIWTPDGKKVTFPSMRTGSEGIGIFMKPVDRSLPGKQLTQASSSQQPLSWSPDGKSLVFHQSIHPITGWDIWMLTLGDDSTPSPILNSESNERLPALSPDGRWLAYASDESGRPEVYITTFPSPSGRWQISTQGGSEPAWARDGKELFYRNADKMMAVDIVTDPDFIPGKPQLMFEGSYIPHFYGRNFDVEPDGNRFVMVKAVEQESVLTQINVVLNWFEELKRLVPAKK